MDASLTPDERLLLLQLARAAIESAVHRRPPPALDQPALTATLRRPAATFVTLIRAGRLRGCVGGLEPRQSLAEDVVEHAAMAALLDFRFNPVEPHELPELCIEISVLSPLRPLDYACWDELPRRLRPERDGVLLSCGPHRATFLPQVWQKVPDPVQFLNLLCEKMGLAPDAWQNLPMKVSIYEVEEFAESDLTDSFPPRFSPAHSDGLAPQPPTPASTADPPPTPE